MQCRKLTIFKTYVTFRLCSMFWGIPCRVCVNFQYYSFVLVHISLSSLSLHMIIFNLCLFFCFFLYHLPSKHTHVNIIGTVYVLHVKRQWKNVMWSINARCSKSNILHKKSRWCWMWWKKAKSIFRIFQSFCMTFIFIFHFKSQESNANVCSTVPNLAWGRKF